MEMTARSFGKEEAVPASYFSMFCVALVPPLWRILMDPRLDALAQARSSVSRELPEWLRAEQRR